jgi:hypothetical protein
MAPVTPKPGSGFASHPRHAGGKTMNDRVAKDGLQLRSLVKESGELELSLVRVATLDPAAD